MSDEEAKGVLRAEFLKLRASGYDDLAARLAGKQERSEVIADFRALPITSSSKASGMTRSTSSLRVVASIDDGGLRAFLPFTESFTISPSGSITDHSAA